MAVALGVGLLLAGCTAGQVADPVGPRTPAASVAVSAAPTDTSAAPTDTSATPPDTSATPTDTSAQPYCQGIDPCVPASLWRPLAVPHLDPGQPCPVSRVVQHPAGSPFTQGVGEGPVFAGTFFPPQALAVQLPPGPDQTLFAGSGWGGEKVLWHAAPGYLGPVLIRGRQLDGPHVVRFETGASPQAALLLPTDQRTGWRDWPSYTRVEAPGCYAWQVDGATFTELITFRVVAQP